MPCPENWMTKRLLAAESSPETGAGCASNALTPGVCASSHARQRVPMVSRRESPTTARVDASMPPCDNTKSFEAWRLEMRAIASICLRGACVQAFDVRASVFTSATHTN